MQRGNRVLVVGLGYVGRAVADAASCRGFEVTGLDIDAAHAAHLNRTGPYRVISDPRAVDDFDVAVIAVPTLLRDGAPDLAHLQSAARSVGARLAPGALVLVESTVYPGVTRSVVGTGLEEASGLTAGADFGLGYSAERLNPGPGSPSLSEIPRVIAGLDEDSLRRTREFYEVLVPFTVEVSSIEVAELAKLIENTFRHINIAFVNELAMAEPVLGANVREALDAAASKPYGFMKFTPGIGVGGDCIPVSPRYLDWAVTSAGGSPLRFVELANDIDSATSRHVTDHAQEVLAEQGLRLDGARILVVGIAYKANVPEVRESAALRIATSLGEMGALVAAADEVIPREMWPSTLRRVKLTAEVVAQHDLAIVLVRHDNVPLTALYSGEPRILDATHSVHEGRVVQC